MKKLKKSVKISLALLTVGGVFIANNIPEEKEILVTASKNFVEASPSKEDNEKSADAWVIANKSKTNTRNENDIYAIKSKEDGIQNIPLKATEHFDNGLQYFLLDDGQGSMYISFEDLKNGQNYIGFVTYSDKLISVIESDFEFTYQEIFNDEEYRKLSKDVSKRLLDKVVFKF